MAPRAIIHLDLDAFYASVEQLRHPELRGQAVIVGGAPGHTRRSVVSAASYEARNFGVHSAMPLITALRLCPKAVVVPVDFPAYREASGRVFEIARRFTPMVEPLSLDEAFLEVTGSQRRFGPAPAIAAAIRDQILSECGLHASFGVAGCKVVAKVASDLRKPRGFVVVEPGDEAAFLAPLPLRRLPGLGPATERALAGLGISTLGELARLPLEVVVRRTGRAVGRHLWERAQGIDPSEVALPGQPRSISREQTFERDVADPVELRNRVRQLAADVAARLRAGSLVGRTVSLRVRYRDFTTVSRQLTLAEATHSERAVAAAARGLLGSTWEGTPVRLLGVGVSGLEAASQLDLISAERRRDGDIDRVLDELRRRFGAAAPRRGTAGEDLSDLDFRGEDLRQPGGE